MPKPALQVPPLPPAAPDVRERAMAGFVLGLLALIGTLFMGQFHPQRGVYLLAVSLAFSVLAISLSIRTGRQVRRSGTARPRAVVGGAVFGWAALALALLWTLALVMFWSQLTDYAACMDQASTVAAAHACQDQLSNSIGSQITLLQGGR